MADTEIRVMGEVKMGDASRFERIVAKYERSVFNIIYRFLGRTADAEDLAQEVFLRIWKAAKTYEKTAKFSTFLYRITANVCISSIRARKRSPEVSLEAVMRGVDTDHKLEVVDESAARPGSRLEKDELALKVRQALDSLPESQRMAVILRRWEDCSYTEIAETMDTTVSAVKSLLVRARESLRRRLGPFVEKM